MKYSVAFLLLLYKNQCSSLLKLCKGSILTNEIFCDRIKEKQLKEFNNGKKKNVLDFLYGI